MSELTLNREQLQKLTHSDNNWLAAYAVMALEYMDVRGRLAEYEAQTIPRTEDMPADACAWMREWNPIRSDWMHHWCCFGDKLYTRHAAPDLLPDTQGPAYRAIVDVRDRHHTGTTPSEEAAAAQGAGGASDFTRDDRGEGQ